MPKGVGAGFAQFVAGPLKVLLADLNGTLGAYGASGPAAAATPSVAQGSPLLAALARRQPLEKQRATTSWGSPRWPWTPLGHGLQASPQPARQRLCTLF